MKATTSTPASPHSMPLSYRRYEDLTPQEFKAIRMKARQLDLTGDECLNFLVETVRRGNFNDLTTYLEYLANLR